MEKATNTDITRKTIGHNTKTPPIKGVFLFVIRGCYDPAKILRSQLAEKDIAADRFEVDRFTSAAVNLHIHRPAAHLSAPPVGPAKIEIRIHGARDRLH